MRWACDSRRTNTTAMPTRPPSPTIRSHITPKADLNEIEGRVYFPSWSGTREDTESQHSDRTTPQRARRRPSTSEAGPGGDPPNRAPRRPVRGRARRRERQDDLCLRLRRGGALAPRRGHRPRARARPCRRRGRHALRPARPDAAGLRPDAKLGCSDERRDRPYRRPIQPHLQHGLGEGVSVNRSAASLGPGQGVHSRKWL